MKRNDAFSANGGAHPIAWGAFYWPLESGYLPASEPARDRALESIDLATKAQMPNLIKRRANVEIREASIVNDIFQQYFQEMLTGKIGIQQGVAALSREWRARMETGFLLKLARCTRHKEHKDKKHSYSLMCV